MIVELDRKEITEKKLTEEITDLMDKSINQQKENADLMNKGINQQKEITDLMNKSINQEKEIANLKEKIAALESVSKSTGVDR
jgi:predicted  nucleic acid-binding Zn-ribbon protein